MSEFLEKLQKTWDFTVEKDPADRLIIHFCFKDGRQYKLQKPDFMALHEVVVGSENIDHEIFLLGLKNLYPENEQSPKITTKYLEDHRDEGFRLWSALIRELLLSE